MINVFFIHSQNGRTVVHHAAIDCDIRWIDYFVKHHGSLQEKDNVKYCKTKQKISFLHSHYSMAGPFFISSVNMVISLYSIMSFNKC